MSEAKKIELLDQLAIGLLIIDKNFRVIYVNRWLRMRTASNTPVTPGTVLLNSWTREHHPRFHSCLHDSSSKRLSFTLSSILNSAPFELIGNKGELRFNMYITPFGSDDSGQVMVQITDETQLRARESFLHNQHRLIQDQDRQLFEKGRHLAINDLTGQIAHQINNPLAIIASGLRLIEKRIAKQQYEELPKTVEDSQKALKRVADLIREIRNLDHRPKLDDFKVTTIKECIVHVLDLIEDDLNAYEIQVLCEQGNEPFDTEILALPGQIEKLLHNILSNSVDFTKSCNDKWIYIDIEETKNEINLIIQDSGTGIDENIKEQIFLPFFTTRDFGEGVGLGLSTALKIARVHGGNIRLDPTTEATKFIVTLPKAHRPA